MAKMAFNKNKFLWRELTMNADGKTSASGFIGVYLGFIAGLAFIGTMIGYFLGLPETVDVMDNIIQLVFATSLLLGVRKAGSFMHRRGRRGSLTTTTSSEYSSPEVDEGTDEETYESTDEGTEPERRSSNKHINEDPDNPT